MKTTRLEIHRKMFLPKRAAYNNLIRDTKDRYYRSRIENNDQKKLFSVIDEIIGNKSDTSLPAYSDPSELAQKFSDYFDSKIDTLMQSFIDTPPETVSVSLGHSFDNFFCVKDAYVNTLIKSMKSKSCGLDPLPTNLLKLVLSETVPLLTKIVNYSPSSGEFPCSGKCAVVTPLLKKPGLDANNLKNYRPVSNISLVGEVIEKIVFDRINDYLTANSLCCKFQSAYLKFHSTVRALV